MAPQHRPQRKEAQQQATPEDEVIAPVAVPEALLADRVELLAALDTMTARVEEVGTQADQLMRAVRRERYLI